MSAKSFTQAAIHGARRTVPGWSALDKNSFLCRSITGGLTNRLALVWVKQDKSDLIYDKALVRIFGEGTDDFIDRAAEEKVAKAMSDTGVAPVVFGNFPGGRTEEFIDNAHMFTTSKLRNPANTKELARLMASMHNIPPNAFGSVEHAQPVTPLFLRRLWNKAAQVNFNNFPALKALKVAALQAITLAQEIDWLEAELEESGMGRVLCHRDMQAGNILVQPASPDTDSLPPLSSSSSEEETSSSTHTPNTSDTKTYMIDFEYSGLDYCGFDYGNLFCEMTVDNFCPVFPGYVLNPGKYPDDNMQYTFFKEYLAHIHDPLLLFPTYQGGGGGIERRQSISTQDLQIEKLMQHAKLGMLCSHLQWALWGIVQEEHHEIADFGYIEYATARLDQYHVLSAEYKNSVVRVPH